METVVVALVFAFAFGAFMIWALLQWRAPRHCPHCGSEHVEWTHKSKSRWAVLTPFAFWHFNCSDCGHAGRDETFFR